jgi:spore germination protein GerM
MPQSYHESRRPHHEPRKSLQKPWRRRLILWGVLAVLIFCVGLVVGYLKIRKAPHEAPVAVETSSPLTREVILYFSSVNARTLVAETRKINECQLEEDCLSDTVRALIAGPKGSLAPILPTEVELRGIAVTDSLVSIDFSRELIAAHPGGTQSELLTIYGLVNTLAVNFPHLRQMQILVEGTPVATLKGHVDLRQPINPDFSLVEEGSLVEEDLAPTGK